MTQLEGLQLYAVLLDYELPSFFQAPLTNHSSGVYRVKSFLPVPYPVGLSCSTGTELGVGWYFGLCWAWWYQTRIQRGISVSLLLELRAISPNLTLG